MVFYYFIICYSRQSYIANTNDSGISLSDDDCGSTISDRQIWFVDESECERVSNELDEFIKINPHSDNPTVFSFSFTEIPTTNTLNVKTHRKAF